MLETIVTTASWIITASCGLAGGSIGALVFVVFLGNNCDDSGFPQTGPNARRTWREGVVFVVGGALGAKMGVLGAELAVAALGAVKGLLF